MSKERRSRGWHGKLDKERFIHRSWMKNQGFPAEFPVMSLGETQMKPTALLFRDLLAMDVEESIRAHVIDGVVLPGGCDKTTPGQLIGAASVDLPSIVVGSGPMPNGKWKGQDIGSGTDVWKFSEAVRAGDMTLQDFMAAETGMSRSKGVCMTMGMASTMASPVEAMGMCLPTDAALPAVDARRMALVHLTGMRIVEMVDEDLKPSDIMTRKAFENAILANAAVGGSTNAVEYLLAIAGRVGVDLTLTDFEIGGEIPLLVNCMPSGKNLMEDFCHAGGMPAVQNELGGRLRRARTVPGADISAYADGAECHDRDVIRPFDDSPKPAAGLRVLSGNLAPDGVIIKPSAATDALLEHEGEAFVFETIEDLKAKMDREDLLATPDTILVLKGCGPKGYPGMPEVGNMPIPKQLVRHGVRDMFRVSDARMSGTAFGTLVLHVSPEASSGGVLPLVKPGDRIRLSASEGRLELLVGEQELAARRAAWKPAPSPTRGAMRRCILTTFFRPTGVPTSISSSARMGGSSQGRVTDVRLGKVPGSRRGECLHHRGRIGDRRRLDRRISATGRQGCLRAKIGCLGLRR